MSKLQTRNAFTNTSLQDTDLFWIDVDMGGGVFQSQKITGLQLKTILSQDPIVNDVVFIDQNTPTTAGVTFDPNTPTTQDILYISTTNGSTWIYNGSTYITYTMPTSSSSNFYLGYTTTDAGANKTATIERSGQLNIRNATNLVRLDATTGLYVNNNSYSQVQQYTASNSTFPLFRQFRKRGNLTTPTDALNGDTLGYIVAGSTYDSIVLQSKATENHSSGVAGSELIVKTTPNGSNTAVEVAKFTQDGKLKLGNAFSLPKVDGTSNQVLQTNGSGVTSWQTLDKTSVGLGNVANVDTTNASNISSGTLGTARMGSGTANNTTYLRGDGTWATPSSGGLTKFTEAESTTSPNATVYVDSLTAAGSSTNVDFAIKPKGTGAILAAIPDSTAVGGDKRGTYAVDLQMSRSSASQVASGGSSFIVGSNNTASGTYSIALGYSNTSNSNQSSFCLGQSNSTNNANYAGALGGGNTSSGSYSMALGGGNLSSGTASISLGWTNTASGSYSTAMGIQNTASASSCVALGNTNTASGSISTAIGLSNIANSYGSLSLGNWASSNSIIRKISFGLIQWSDGSSYANMSGALQSGKIMYSAKTTDATTTTLTTDQQTASTTNQLTLINRQAIRFKGTIIGKQNGNSLNVGVWDVDGIIVRGIDASTTTLVVNNVNLVSNASSWGTPVLSADTTNGCLKVQVTGLGATTIGWFCNLETSEVAYY